MTLGNAATAKVRLILWCKACRHQVEPDPAELARTCGPDSPCPIGVLGWCGLTTMSIFRLPISPRSGAEDSHQNHLRHHGAGAINATSVPIEIAVPAPGAAPAVLAGIHSSAGRFPR